MLVSAAFVFDSIRALPHISPPHITTPTTQQYKRKSEFVGQVIAPGPKGSVMTRNFTFHGCLAPNSKQSDVLKICGITQLLNAAMAGYHATIFAYGQTGSGKTYTMSGREDVIDSDDYAGAPDSSICCPCALSVLFVACTIASGSLSCQLASPLASLDWTCMDSTCNVF